MRLADKQQMAPQKIKALSVKKKRIRLFCAALITVTWGVLYLPNISTTPRWYGDETTTIACGQDLAHGIFANRAVWNTYINPQFCYQPGYVLIVGALSNFGIKTIIWPRVFNSLLALSIAFIFTFLLGRRIGYSTGLLGALIFLTYEQTVIHFRWVYPHNATALGLFGCFAIQCLRADKLRSWQAGIGLAIAAASHPLAIQGGFAGWLNRFNRPSCWLRLFLPPIVVGLICILPPMLWNPNWWWSDLIKLGDFYGSFTEDSSGGFKWPLNFVIFLSHDWLHLLAGVALFACLFTSVRPIAISALIITALLTRNRQNLPVFYYQAVIALPMLVACISVTLMFFRKRFLRRIPMMRYAAYILPFFLFVNTGCKVWTNSLISRNDLWVVRSIEDHLQTINWINLNTSPRDLVLCSPNLGWKLNCRNADFLMTTAWNGFKTFPYISGLDKDRFRYSCDLNDAKYVVITNIDRIWSLAQPNVVNVINDSTLSGWSVIFVAGECTVLSRNK